MNNYFLIRAEKMTRAKCESVTQLAAHYNVTVIGWGFDSGWMTLIILSVPEMVNKLCQFAHTLNDGAYCAAMAVSPDELETL